MTKRPAIGTSLWSSKLAFLLAAIGFSVGLGNIWRFPYLAGTNGGGAFVLLYIACVILIAIPIVVAELAIGRKGGKTPAATMSSIAKANGRSPSWGLVGAFTMVMAFLILTYYFVIGGWTLYYTLLSGGGSLVDVSVQSARAIHDEFLGNPWLIVAFQTVFMAVNVMVSLRSLQKGLERAVIILMPTLFFLLASLAIYGLIVGNGREGLQFMFAPDFDNVTVDTLLSAMGQAFFSIGVGMAALMTYGAYLPKHVSIPRTASTICFADMGIAIVAGMAIFPLVFAYGLSPSEGTGLVFVTIPVALGGVPGGGVVATAFFLLLFVAALTSSLGLFEVLVRWGEERGQKRTNVALVAGIACWVPGLGTVFSSNLAANYFPLNIVPGFEGLTIFEAIDRVSSVLGLQIGGFLLAVFAGYAMSNEMLAEELSIDSSGALFRLWRFALRWPLPLVILALLMTSAYDMP